MKIRGAQVYDLKETDQYADWFNGITDERAKDRINARIQAPNQLRELPKRLPSPPTQGYRPLPLFGKFRITRRCPPNRLYTTKGETRFTEKSVKPAAPATA